MARNSEIERLRAEAHARHRAATRKVSRLKTRKGAEIAGTKLDPRTDLEKIKHYNSTQLRSYIQRLNQFTDRSTQFVGDASKRAVPSSLWSKYKQLESAYNKQVSERFSQVENLYSPHIGMTLGERMEMITPRHRQMAFTPVNAPYKPPERSPQNVQSERALKRLIRDMEQRLKPQHVDRLTREARTQFTKMVEMLNDRELMDATNKLTNRQFDVLWNYTPFARAISLGYELAMAQLSNEEKPWHSQIMQTAQEDARAHIEWAGSLNLGR